MLLLSPSLGMFGVAWTVVSMLLETVMALDPPRPPIKGDVHLPSDQHYENFRKMSNGLCQQRPLLIARPVDTADVQILVRFAAANGVPLSVRNGGHSYTCQSIKDGGVHVDMRSMAKVELQKSPESPTGLMATIEGGATWKDVLEVVPTSNYTLVHGDCPGVGAVGYSLTGGIGDATAKHGFAVDQYLGATIVLANGSALTLPEDSRLLWWAVRGAGTSFGIVTQVLYKVLPYPEISTHGVGFTFPWLGWLEDEVDLERILTAQQKAYPNWSIEFWLPMTYSHEGLGGPVLTILNDLRRLFGKRHVPAILEMVYIGGGTLEHDSLLANAEAFLRNRGVNFAGPFLQVLPAIIEIKNHVKTIYSNPPEVKAMYSDPPEQWMNLFGVEEATLYFEDPAVGIAAAKAVLFGHDSAFNISAADGGLAQFGADCFFCQFDLHSPMGDLPPSMNTSVNPSFRRSRVGFDMNCLYWPRAQKEVSTCPLAVAKQQMLLNRLGRGTATAGYVNMPTCFLEDWQHKFWGENYEQLAELKRTVDPNGLFSFCQSVGSSAKAACCPNANATNFLPLNV